jgi:hypothetical protein
MSKFHEFLLEQAGGEESAQTIFVRTQLTTMIAEGYTLGQILGVAEEQQWSEILLNMTVPSLVPQNTKRKNGHKKVIKRIPAAEVAPKIMDVLADGESRRIGDVAKAIGITPNQVRPAMNNLLQEGAVMRSGQRASTTYQIA